MQVAGLNAPHPLQPSRTRRPLVYDCLSHDSAGADLFSGGPLDLEAIAVGKEEIRRPVDPDTEKHDKEPLTAPPSPRTPRSPSRSILVSLCVRCTTNNESADGLLRGDGSDINVRKTTSEITAVGTPRRPQRANFTSSEIATNAPASENTKCRRRWPSPSRHADGRRLVR